MLEIKCYPQTALRPTDDFLPMVVVDTVTTLYIWIPIYPNDDPDEQLFDGSKRAEEIIESLRKGKPNENCNWYDAWGKPVNFIPAEVPGGFQVYSLKWALLHQDNPVSLDRCKELCQAWKSNAYGAFEKAKNQFWHPFNLWAEITPVVVTENTSNITNSERARAYEKQQALTELAKKLMFESLDKVLRGNQFDLLDMAEKARKAAEILIEGQKGDAVSDGQNEQVKS